MKKISIIVAMNNKRVIGLNNALPWHISEDLKHFKKLTLNHSVVMGRKTFESIGKPLKQRKNIVISRNESLNFEGVMIVNSIDKAISIANDESEIFIIGGEQIYSISLSIATHMYITEVNNNNEGDAFFPNFKKNQWSEISRQNLTSENGLDFSFVEYEKTY
jgi:dihydrofolate reductase